MLEMTGLYIYILELKGTHKGLYNGCPCGGLWPYSTDVPQYGAIMSQRAVYYSGKKRKREGELLRQLSWLPRLQEFDAALKHREFNIADHSQVNQCMQQDDASEVAIPEKAQCPASGNQHLNRHKKWLVGTCLYNMFR